MNSFNERLTHLKVTQEPMPISWLNSIIKAVSVNPATGERVAGQIISLACCVEVLTDETHKMDDMRFTIGEEGSSVVVRLVVLGKEEFIDAFVEILTNEEHLITDVHRIYTDIDRLLV